MKKIFYILICVVILVAFGAGGWWYYAKIYSPTANWQTYRNEKYGFELKIPSQWHEDYPGSFELVSDDNKTYYIIFDSFKIDSTPYGEGDNNLKIKSFFKDGKLLEAEQWIIKSAQEDPNGEIIYSEAVPVMGGSGIEIITKFPGLYVGEPRGIIEETVYTILKNNVIYRFWTVDEKAVPADLKYKYPELNPSRSEMLKKIMSTLKIWK